MFSTTNRQFFARLVLVWFALFIGVAIASPILNPTETQIVCSSAGGMKMLAISEQGEQGEQVKLTANMDCPLCAAAILNLEPCSVGLEKVSPSVHLLHPDAAAHVVSLTAPPLPSRGPPFNF
jgi:hypothetical protein